MLDLCLGTDVVKHAMIDSALWIYFSNLVIKYDILKSLYCFARCLYNNRRMNLKQCPISKGHLYDRSQQDDDSQNSSPLVAETQTGLHFEQNKMNRMQVYHHLELVLHFNNLI